MADTRQRFQGKCFVSSEGHRWMEKYYDNMPPVIRKRLMDSQFNICAGCVDNWHSVDDYNKAIDNLEAAILTELGPFGPDHPQAK